MQVYNLVMRNIKLKKKDHTNKLKYLMIFNNNITCKEYR